MAFIYPIQTAIGQVNNGSVTLTLPGNPLLGNKLLLIVSGFNGGVAPPAGFTLVQANTSDNQYNATWVYQRTVQSGDGTSYSCTSNGDVRMFVLLEVTSVVNQIIVTSGAASLDTSSNTIGTGNLTAYTNNTNYRRIVCFEWDNRGPQYSSNNYSPQFELSDPAFRDSSFANHASYTSFGQASQGGSFTLTLTQTPNYPVWMDVVLVASGPAVVGRITRDFIFSSFPSYTTSLSQQATAGNLLVLLLAEAYADSIQVPGFTYVGGVQRQGGPSIDCYSKIADGSETGISLSGLANDGGQSYILFNALEVAGATAVSSTQLINNPFSGSNVYNFNQPGLAGSSVDSFRLQLLLWSQNHNLVGWSPSTPYDVAGYDIHFYGNNSNNFSYYPTIYPMEAASQGRSITLQAIGGGAASAPSSSNLWTLDFMKPAIGSSGSTSVMWLM